MISLATNYDISYYAATYLVRAIVMAQAKNTAGVKDLGLSVSDFKNLFDGKETAAAKVDILSAKLKIDNAPTARLVQEMTADVQAEKAARGIQTAVSETKRSRSITKNMSLYKQSDASR